MSYTARLAVDYAIQKDELILDLLRTGSHSDVF